jgi:hypothetical protein
MWKASTGSKCGPRGQADLGAGAAQKSSQLSIFATLSASVG